jgi:hypothetical protein
MVIGSSPTRVKFLLPLYVFVFYRALFLFSLFEVLLISVQILFTLNLSDITSKFRTVSMFIIVDLETIAVKQKAK